MNRKRQQSEQTKARLAEAARALFARKGFKATSIEDIVAATGCSKGNIYYHFQSKEGLFRFLLDAWSEEWRAQWEERQASYATVQEKMQVLVEGLIVEDLNHPLSKALDEFVATELTHHDGQQLVASYLEEHLRFNQELLQEGMDKGELRQDDAGELAIVLEAMLMGLAEMSKRMPMPHGDLLHMHRKALEVFLHGTLRREES